MSEDTPNPKASAPKPKATPAPTAKPVVEEKPMAIYDAIVGEEAVEAPEPVAVATSKSKAPASPPHVVSGNETDTVFLSRLVFKNKYERKSLSVHHLQRRLVEWGHLQAASDRDGYFGDVTYHALREFQHNQGLPTTGLPDEATLTALFENDQNVTVSLA